MLARVKAATLGFVLVLTCGCSSGSNDSPYAQEFQVARSQTSNPTILAMLEDGVVTDQEYLEAEQIAARCVEDAGFPVEILEEGLKVSNVLDKPQSEVNAVYKKCAQDTLDVVGDLYFNMKTNPDNQDWNLLVLNCMKKFKVVDDNFTLDQFKAVDIENPPWPKLSGDAYGCETDPTGYSGDQPDLEPGEGFKMRTGGQ